jgi:hypothetical protein
LGVRVGGFRIYPKLNVDLGYNDNIFATSRDERDDMITEFAPRVEARSDWGRHALDLYANAALGRYLTNTNEDYEDYGAGAHGRIDVTPRAVAIGLLETQKLHEARGSPDDTAGVHPTEYRQHAGEIELRQRMGRFDFTISGDARRYDFFDNFALSDGTFRPINNHDRDRWSLDGALRFGYEIVPDYEAFVRGAYNIQRYDVELDDFGFKRDSEGPSIQAGVRLDLTGLIFGDLYAGYLSRSYDDPRLATVSGPLFGARLTWNVTPLTTVIGFFDRSIEETTLAGASGNFATKIGISADHELLRNLLLRAEGGALRYEYRGAGRVDDTVSFAFGARYLMNRNCYVSARYGEQHRDSNVSGGDFDQRTAILRVEAQY